MLVQLRIYDRNPSAEEYETIEREVPAFWPVPHADDHILLDLSKHATTLEGDLFDISTLKVITVSYELDDTLTTKKVVITTQKV